MRAHLLIVALALTGAPRAEAQPAPAPFHASDSLAAAAFPGGGALIGLAVYPILALVEPRMRPPSWFPGGSAMFGFAAGAALGAVLGEGGEWTTIYPNDRARLSAK